MSILLNHVFRGNADIRGSAPSRQPRPIRRVSAALVGVLTVGAALAATTQTAGAAPSPGAPAGTYVAIGSQLIANSETGENAPRGGIVGQQTLTMYPSYGGTPTSGVTAVAIRVSVVAPTTNGDVILYPTGSTRPAASNLNFSPGRNVTGIALVRPGAGGDVSLYVNAPTTSETNVVVSGFGYYSTGTSNTAGGYQPLASGTRLLDTRSGNGAPAARVPGRATLSFQASGRNGVPATGIAALAVTFIAVNPTSAGDLVVYPSSSARPGISALDYSAGATTSGFDVVRLGSDGRVSVYVNSAVGSKVDLVADVTGYYISGTATAAGSYVPLQGSRILDTRSGVGASKGRVPPGHQVTVQVTGRNGVPASGVSAAVVTVTGVTPTLAGSLSATAQGATPTAFEDVDLNSAETAAGVSIVPVSSTGQISIWVQGGPDLGSTDVLADLVGYVRG